MYAVALGVSAELVKGLALRLPQVVGQPLVRCLVRRSPRVASTGSIRSETSSGSSFVAASTPNNTGSGGGFSGGGGGGGGGGGFGAR